MREGIDNVALVLASLVRQHFREELGLLLLGHLLLVDSDLLIGGEIENSAILGQ